MATGDTLKISSGKEILVAYYNKKKNLNLTIDDVEFSTPERLTLPGTLTNSSVRIFPKLGTPFNGSPKIYYDRVHISYLGTIVIDKGNAIRLYDLLPAINTKYNINITEDDIENELLNPTQHGEILINFKIKPTSITYYDGDIIYTPNYPDPNTVANTEVDKYGFWSIELSDPGVTITGDNLTAEMNKHSMGVCGIPVTTNKSYWEVKIDEVGLVVGVATEDAANSNPTEQVIGMDNKSWGLDTSTGTFYNNGIALSYCPPIPIGSTLGVMLDVKGGILTYMVGNSIYNVAAIGFEQYDKVYPVICGNGDVLSKGTANFGQNPMMLTPPADYARGVYTLKAYQPPSGGGGGDYPSAGTVFAVYCRGFDRWGVFADGNGGAVDQLVQLNSSACGAPVTVTASLSCAPTAVTIVKGNIVETVYTLSNPLEEVVDFDVGVDYAGNANATYHSALKVKIGSGAFADVVSNKISIPVGDVTFTVRTTIVSNILPSVGDKVTIKVKAADEFAPVITTVGWVTFAITIQNSSIPPEGMLLSTYCNGFDNVGVYADGLGGSYEETIEVNSETCGYVPFVERSIKATGTGTFNLETNNSTVQITARGGSGETNNYIEVPTIDPYADGDKYLHNIVTAVGTDTFALFTKRIIKNTSYSDKSIWKIDSNKNITNVMPAVGGEVGGTTVTWPFSMVSIKNKIYTGLGQYLRTLHYTEDGVTWLPTTGIPEGTSLMLYDAKSFGNKVGIYYNDALGISDNGVDFTTCAIPTAMLPSNTQDFKPVDAISYHAGLFYRFAFERRPSVLIADLYCYTSVDGVTWTKSGVLDTYATSTFGTSGFPYVFKIALGDAVHLRISGKKTAESAEAVFWYKTTNFIDFAASTVVDFGTVVYEGVYAAIVNDTYLAVQPKNVSEAVKYYWTKDLLTWNEVNPKLKDNPRFDPGNSDPRPNVRAYNGRFILDYNDVYAVSSDAANWSVHVRKELGQNIVPFISFASLNLYLVTKYSKKYIKLEPADKAYLTSRNAVQGPSTTITINGQTEVFPGSFTNDEPTYLTRAVTLPATSNLTIQYNAVSNTYIQLDFSGRKKNYPPKDQLVGESCVGFDRVRTYTDGEGGNYTLVTEYYSETCGYNRNTLKKITLVGNDSLTIPASTSTITATGRGSLGQPTRYEFATQAEPLRVETVENASIPYDNGVVQFNGLYYTVMDRRLYNSSDLVTWTIANATQYVDSLLGVADNKLYIFNSTFRASNDIMYSYDGLNFTNITYDAMIYGLWCIAHLNGVTLITSATNGSYYLRSVDGINFFRAYNPAGGNKTQSRVITYNNKFIFSCMYYYYAPDRPSQILYHSDTGASGAWVSAGLPNEHSDTVFGATSDERNGIRRIIDAGSFLLAAIGTTRTIGANLSTDICWVYKSTDGVNWTLHATNLAAYDANTYSVGREITYVITTAEWVHDKLICTLQDSIYTSNDGINWTLSTLENKNAFSVDGPGEYYYPVLNIPRRLLVGRSLLTTGFTGVAKTMVVLPGDVIMTSRETAGKEATILVDGNVYTAAPQIVDNPATYADITIPLGYPKPIPLEHVCPPGSLLSIEYMGLADDNPAAGTQLGTICHGYDNYGIYANGAGGQYEKLLEINSATCGYVEPIATASVYASRSALAIKEGSSDFINYYLSRQIDIELGLRLDVTYLTAQAADVAQFAYMLGADPTEYPIVPGDTLTIPVNTTTFKLKVTIAMDAEEEPDETFTINYTPIVGVERFDTVQVETSVSIKDLTYVVQPTTLSTANLDGATAIVYNNNPSHLAVSNKNTIRTDTLHNTDKWYVEFDWLDPNAVIGFGVMLETLPSATAIKPGSNATSWGFSSGQKYSNGVAEAYGESWDNKRVGIAVDLVAGDIKIYLNGVSQGIAFTGLVEGYFLFGTIAADGIITPMVINFGHKAQQYTPVGYRAGTGLLVDKSTYVPTQPPSQDIHTPAKTDLTKISLSTKISNDTLTFGVAPGRSVIADTPIGVGSNYWEVTILGNGIIRMGLTNTAQVLVDEITPANTLVGSTVNSWGFSSDMQQKFHDNVTEAMTYAVRTNQVIRVSYNSETMELSMSVDGDSGTVVYTNVPRGLYPMFSALNDTSDPVTVSVNYGQYSFKNPIYNTEYWPGLGTPLINPIYGMFISDSCTDTTRTVVYADGNGDTFTSTYTNSEFCGYVPPAGMWRLETFVNAEFSNANDQSYLNFYEGEYFIMSSFDLRSGVGDWYWEIKPNSDSTSISIGIANDDAVYTELAGNAANVIALRYLDYVVYCNGVQVLDLSSYANGGTYRLREMSIGMRYVAATNTFSFIFYSETDGIVQEMAVPTQLDNSKPIVPIIGMNRMVGTEYNLYVNFGTRYTFYKLGETTKTPIPLAANELTLWVVDPGMSDVILAFDVYERQLFYGKAAYYYNIFADASLTSGKYYWEVNNEKNPIYVGVAGSSLDQYGNPISSTTTGINLETGFLYDRGNLNTTLSDGVDTLYNQFYAWTYIGFLYDRDANTLTIIGQGGNQITLNTPTDAASVFIGPAAMMVYDGTIQINMGQQGFVNTVPAGATSVLPLSTLPYDIWKSTPYVSYWSFDESIIYISFDLGKSTTIMTEKTLSTGDYYFELEGYNDNLIVGFAYDGHDGTLPIGQSPGTAGINYATGEWVCEGVATQLFATMQEFIDNVRFGLVRMEVSFDSKTVYLRYSNNTFSQVSLPNLGTNFSAAVTVLQNPRDANKYTTSGIDYQMGRYQYSNTVPEGFLTMYDLVDTGGGF